MLRPITPETALRFGGLPVIARPWIKRRLLDLGKTQKGLAKALVRDASAVTRLISGERPLTNDEIHTLADFLEMTPIEILEQLGGGTPAAPIPVSGFIGEDGNISGKPPIGAPPRIVALREVPARAGFSGEVFIVATRSLPRYEIGDALFCERVAAIDQALGKECVVTVPGAGRALRRLIAGTRAGRFVLVSRSGETAVDATVDEALPVVWILSGDRLV